MAGIYLVRRDLQTLGTFSNARSARDASAEGPSGFYINHVDPWTGCITNINFIIESVDSISRDERDASYTLQTLEYLVLGTLSRILNTTIVFYG